MTFRSSAVIPPVRISEPAVAAIVIVVLPEIVEASIAPRAASGRAALGAFQGNIAVKPLPIRLLALPTAISGRREFQTAPSRDGTAPIAAHNRVVNRFDPWHYCALVCGRATEDNCTDNPSTAVTDSIVTLQQEINDHRRQHAPHYRR